MRLYVLLTILSAAVLVAFAGSAHADDDNKAKLAASIDRWDDLKQKCGGNYRYFVRTVSFSGFRTETEIVVQRNKVTGRRYKETGGFGGGVVIGPAPIDGEPKPKPKDEYKWTERGDEIGTNKGGAPAKTLDELYAEAEKILEHDFQPSEKLYLRFDKNGLLKQCFYVDTRIADDAPTHGVMIDGLKLE